MHSFSVGILLGLLTSSALASPAATKVLTLGGYRLSTDVHEVPAGGRVSHVGNDVHLVGADGTVLHVVPNVMKAMKPAAEPVPPQQSGWITYTSWLNTSPSPISNFSTTYTVPAPPNTYHGQTVFLFNSIEPSSFDVILQPVLQYGPSTAGGGQYWSAATWYLYGPLVFYPPLVQVEGVLGGLGLCGLHKLSNIGQLLNGLISLVVKTGSTYSYTVQYSNIPGTLMRMDNVEELTWATETLEAYNIAAAINYPPSLSTFYEINLDFTSPAPTVSWGVTNDEADRLFTTINRDGAFQGVLTITY
ncbi:hypothetical protein DFH08DRAFT_967822 [Mycena albidolilacea]|uniref:Uncharacterized protein n=1 Tax=Mycena albidolilacea TaxID=1033008 RepID=A0AAD6ZL84_9AGAR|nr:hypothetical protein DFH08DRAFT_967822 [Mycena albidolilacea]